MSMLALVTIGVLAVGCASDESGSSDSSEDRELTFGYTEWIDNVAIANLTAVLLEEEFDYEVEFQVADLGPIFEGVGRGDLDGYLSVWLPVTHGAYMQSIEDDAVEVGRWYGGQATIGLAVPEYVEARTIEDLNRLQGEFGGQIHGIEAGAGMMEVLREDVIPGYNLEDYELLSASTPAMLAEVESAIDDERPVVHAAWEPHWMFTAYPIRYLEDPEGLMGEPEEISTVVREGLEQDSPAAFALLENLTLSEEQFGELALAIEEGGYDTPEDGTRAWLEDNRDVVQPALDAAREAQGAW
jgi:glycine betaine/proline transport system substrate-binding protein